MVRGQDAFLFCARLLNREQHFSLRAKPAGEIGSGLKFASAGNTTQIKNHCRKVFFRKARQRDIELTECGGIELSGPDVAGAVVQNFRQKRNRNRGSLCAAGCHNRGSGCQTTKQALEHGFLFGRLIQRRG